MAAGGNSQETRRVRGGLVLVQDGKVALIRRVRQGKVYFTFPGGGAEPGENPEDAARREALEELGLAVHLGRLLIIVRFGNSIQYYYQATVSGGEFGKGRGAEMSSEADSESGSFEPVWIPIARLSHLDVRPKIIADALVVDPELRELPAAWVER